MKNPKSSEISDLNTHHTHPHFRRALYPGSFDPITLGHIDIIKRIATLYDEVIVVVAHSPEKTALFTPEERKKLIIPSLSDLKNVKVDAFNGLTVEYANRVEAQVIVRGLRAVVDFEYELSMANINKKIQPYIETVLVFANPIYYFISSRGVKEVARHGGELDGLVPDHVISPLLKKMKTIEEVYL